MTAAWCRRQALTIMVNGRLACLGALSCPGRSPGLVSLQPLTLPQKHGEVMSMSSLKFLL